MISGDTFGDYKVVRLLGKGGMGEVWLVRRAGTDELYALKTLSAEVVAKDPLYVKRFIREGEFACSIRHPNLVAVYAVGQDAATGQHYIVMEYVSDGSLRDELDRRGRFEIAEAVEIIRQVSYGLAAAHQRGVVHRDIKPDNIMFAADGTPKLADLGIARFSGDQRLSTVTTDGSFMGTPAYMSPEQMMNAHDVDARADIYSLGVVFYEMLTGERPNKDDTIVQLMAKAVKGIPIPDVRKLRPEVSASLVQVLNVMCARRPGDRFDSSQRMVDVLERLRQEGFDTNLGLRQPKDPRHGSWRSLGFGGIAVALVCVVVVYDRLGTFEKLHAEVVERFGMPEGLEPLTRGEASHRAGHWQFSYRGRRGLFGERILREISYRNARGIPIGFESESNTEDGVDEERHACSRLYYSESGNLAHVDRYTPYGKRIRRDIFSGQGNIYVDFKFPLADGGLLSASRFGDAKISSIDVTALGAGIESASKTAVRRIRLTRDAKGFVIREYFMANDMNVPARGPHNAYAREFSRDQNGRVVCVRYLDDEGRPVSMGLGVYAVEYRRDPSGRIASVRNLDANGRLILGNYGWAEMRQTWNAHDGCVRSAYYDAVGAPSVANDGVAARVRTFDDRGCLTTISFHGLDDRLVNDSQGFAVVRFFVDDRGFLSGVRHEDAVGNPFPAPLGDYAVQYEHDARGLRVREWYLDREGKPFRRREGVAEIRRTYYADGVMESESYFDERGNPCTSSGRAPSGSDRACRLRFLRDENGRHLAYRSIDAIGNPCFGLNGFSEERIAYDAYGNAVSASYWDPSGKPAVFAYMGCHELIRSFDAGGRVTQVRFADTSGKPCPYAQALRYEQAQQGAGVFRISYSYDARGYLVRVAYADAEGRPMADANGIAAIERDFNARGLTTERRFLDAQGKPVAHRNDGRSKIRFIYDELGRIVGTDGFDAEDRPKQDQFLKALNPKGVFRRKAYDGRGRVLCTWVVDAEGKRIDETSCLYRYEENGQIIGSCRVDAGGCPVNGPRGFAYVDRITDRYDRLTHLLYRRADGSPHLLPKEVWGGGWSGFDCRYYPNGSEMWKLHLGADGKPARVNGGACGWAREYHTDGTIARQVYLDADGTPMLNGSKFYGWWLQNGKRQPIRERPELTAEIRASLQEYFAGTEFRHS